MQAAEPAELAGQLGAGGRDEMAAPRYLRPRVEQGAAADGECIGRVEPRAGCRETRAQPRQSCRVRLQQALALAG